MPHDLILQIGSKWRHVRRGGVYTIEDFAILQRHGMGDNERLVIYRGEDGQLWARPVSEFRDGRFVEVTDAP